MPRTPPRLWTSAIGVLLLVSTGARAQGELVPHGKDHVAGYSERPARDLLAGDVNGDSLVDVVRIDGEGTHDLYLGMGQGKFERAGRWTLLGTGTLTCAAHLEDLDGDGLQDLLLAQLEPQASFWLRATPASGFERGGVFSGSEQERTREFLVEDVDLDGRKDVLLIREGAPPVLQRSTPGGFVRVRDWLTGLSGDVPQARFVAFDADPIPELVVRQGELLLLARVVTPGRYAITDVIPGTLGVRYMTEGDVDGDGDLDLVWATRQGFRYLERHVAGLASSPRALQVDPGHAERARTFVFADVDEDGRPDLTLVGPERTWLLLARGTGYESVRGRGLPEFATRGLRYVDLDGDTHLDLLATHDHTRASIALGDGRGSFRSIVSDGPHAPAPRLVLAADADGDGYEDLIGASANGLELRRFDRFGSYREHRDPILRAQRDVHAIALQDLNGDGLAEWILGRKTEEGGPARNRILSPDVNLVFRDVSSRALPSAPLDRTMSLAIGDLNEDGHEDLLFANDHEPLTLWFGEGAGRFRLSTGRAVDARPAETRAVLLVDLDDDGHLDLVRANGGAEPDTVWRGMGDGTFLVLPCPVLSGLVTDTRSVACLDANGDGRLDLFLGTSPASASRLLLGRGSCAFTDVSFENLPRAGFGRAAVQHVSTGDVDLDGVTDLVLAVGTAPRTRVLLADGHGVFEEHTNAWLPRPSGLPSSIDLFDMERDGDLDLVSGGLRVHRNTLRDLHAPYLLRSGLPMRWSVRLVPEPREFQQVYFYMASEAMNSRRIDPFGLLLLDPATLAFERKVQVAPRLSSVSFTATVPTTPALVGGALCVQALVVNRPTPSGAYFTGAVRDVVR